MPLITGSNGRAAGGGETDGGGPAEVEGGLSSGAFAGGRVLPLHMHQAPGWDSL